MGVIPEYEGGLGNQMFIMAAAYVVQMATGNPMLCFDSPPNLLGQEHNIHKHKYHETIFKNMGAKVPWFLHSSEYKIYCSQNGYIRRTNGQTRIDKSVRCNSAFYPWDPKVLTGNVVMHGYYQYYPALQPYMDAIRACFLSGLETYRSRLLDTGRDWSRCMFLHVRRGDYVTKSNYHFLQPLEYYEKAVKHVCQTNAHIDCCIIFSNDVEWVKQQACWKNPFFEIDECDDELANLATMSLCTGGAVIANSTFSWWGAMLGAHAKGNPVTVPNRWIADGLYYPFLIPSEWTVVNV